MLCNTIKTLPQAQPWKRARRRAAPTKPDGTASNTRKEQPLHAQRTSFSHGGPALFRARLSLTPGPLSSVRAWSAASIATTHPPSLSPGPSQTPARTRRRHSISAARARTFSLQRRLRRAFCCASKTVLLLHPPHLGPAVYISASAGVEAAWAHTQLRRRRRLQRTRARRQLGSSGDRSIQASECSLGATAAQPA